MDPVGISDAVVYLLSDESTWTTALSMAVDGGVTAFCEPGRSAVSAMNVVIV